MLISHRMPDVFAVCDRIIVLRRGTKVADKRDRDNIAGRDHRPDHGSDPCTPETADSRRRGPDHVVDRRRRRHPGADALCSSLIASQAFWVTVALCSSDRLHDRAASRAFGTADNFSNITRNFAPIGIMALGMTVVIITGGIDLSVGSVMGLVAIVAGLFLTWHHPWYVAFGAGLLAGLRVRRLQRLLRRLCRHAVLRGDARHAVDRALAGGRAVRQPDDLPVRARRARSSRRSAGEVAAACA